MKKDDKLSFKEGFWLFFVGCIFGYIMETLFYIIKYGSYVNKQGLLYGPFKPIYGIGTLLITIIYYFLKNKSTLNIFISGLISGTLFEYLASLFIEIVFKSYIWDYSDFKFNINGRIYLPYCIIWGLLSVLWVKYIYPRFKSIFKKASEKKIFNYITVMLLVFMIINILLTSLVLIRIQQKGKTNMLYNVVDKYYPETEINKKFPKFRAIK